MIRPQPRRVPLDHDQRMVTLSADFILAMTRPQQREAAKREAQDTPKTPARAGKRGGK